MRSAVQRASSARVCTPMSPLRILAVQAWQALLPNKKGSSMVGSCKLCPRMLLRKVLLL